MAKTSSRGAGLILSLIALVVLGLLAATVYQLARTLVRESVYQMRSAQAQAIAEAGLEDALYQLHENYSWRAGFTRKPFAGGSYTVRLSTEDAPWVTSTGYSAPMFLIGPAVKTVRVQVEFIWADGEDLAIQAGAVTLHAGALVDAYDSSAASERSESFHDGANLWSNGSLLVESGASVWGTASYFDSGLVNVAAVHGEVVHSTYTRTLTAISYPGANDNAALPTIPADGSSSTGYDPASRDLRVREPKSVYHLPPGSYYLHDILVSGTLTADTADGTVSIYLDGNLDLQPSGQIVNSSRIPARLSIYGQTAQTLSFNSNAPLHADILAPEAGILVGRSQVFYGRIMGKEAAIFGTFHFDQNLGRGQPLHVAWGPGSWSASYLRQ